MEKIKVLVKRPDEHCVLKEIPNTLEAFQLIVGGWIEVIPMDELGRDGIICVCNEDGKLLGLEPNLFANGDTIVGTVVLCGQNGDEFADFPFDPYEDPLWKFAMEERK